jgi:diguanylate cyclase (GGDEF)-like protein
VLQEIGRTLKTGLRGMDIVGRLGGDEFAVLLPEAGLEAAEELLTRVQGGLTKAMDAGGWAVTTSIGAITLEGAAIDLDVLLHEADNLMYTAKQAGKNRIHARVTSSAVAQSA